jgi:hypothetical protein
MTKQGNVDENKDSICKVAEAVMRRAKYVYFNVHGVTIDGVWIGE